MAWLMDGDVSIGAGKPGLVPAVFIQIPVWPDCQCGGTEVAPVSRTLEKVLPCPRPDIAPEFHLLLFGLHYEDSPCRHALKFCC